MSLWDTYPLKPIAGDSKVTNVSNAVSEPCFHFLTSFLSNVQLTSQQLSDDVNVGADDRDSQLSRFMNKCQVSPSLAIFQQQQHQQQQQQQTASASSLSASLQQMPPELLQIAKTLNDYQSSLTSSVVGGGGGSTHKQQ
jgi:hypothetical protein